jgi:hypothetical protein
MNTREFVAWFVSRTAIGFVCTYVVLCFVLLWKVLIGLIPLQAAMSSVLLLAVVASSTVIGHGFSRLVNERL